MVVRIDIKGDLSIARLEEYLSRVARTKAEALRLPFNAKVGGFGSEASLCHLIVNFVRTNPDSRIESYLTTDTESYTERLDSFLRRPYGFFASGLCNSLSDVDGVCFPKAVTEAIRNQLNRYRVDSSQLELFPSNDEKGRLPFVGKRIFFPAVDGREKSMQMLPQLYHFNTEQVRNRVDFESLVKLVLRRLSDNRIGTIGHKLPLSPQSIEGLGAVIFELFDNTNKWALNDADGVKLSHSVRAILIKLLEPQVFEEDEPLKNYCAHEKVQGREMLEISVVDSGPGLAARFKGERIAEDVPMEEELALLYDCIDKGYSTSKINGRGVGLNLVLQNISQLSGFMRLRTGRISVYRDTIAIPHNEFEKAEHDKSLKDWLTHKDEPTKMTPVDGALYSILIPLM